MEEINSIKMILSKGRVEILHNFKTLPLVVINLMQ